MEEVVTINFYAGCIKSEVCPNCAYRHCWCEMMPEVDWNNFNVEELQDNTVGAKNYACSGGSCEIL